MSRLVFRIPDHSREENLSAALIADGDEEGTIDNHVEGWRLDSGQRGRMPMIVAAAASVPSSSTFRNEAWRTSLICTLSLVNAIEICGAAESDAHAEFRQTVFSVALQVMVKRGSSMIPGRVSSDEVSFVNTSGVN